MDYTMKPPSGIADAIEFLEDAIGNLDDAGMHKREAAARTHH
jgi:hypothetical protein